MVQKETTVSLSQIFMSFTRVGAFLFGGGYAMLPLIEREVVDRRGWCRFEEMVDYYAMAQLVPGVIAVNTAILIGHRLRGFLGTLAATTGVVCVPFVVILGYAVAVDQLAGSVMLERAMAGLRPAVAGMMMGIAYNMFVRTRQTRQGLTICLIVITLVLFAGVSAVKVIIAGVGLGILWYGWTVYRTSRCGLVAGKKK